MVVATTGGKSVARLESGAQKAMDEGVRDGAVAGCRMHIRPGDT